MKLISKTQQAYIILMAVFLVLWSFLFLFFISSILDDDLDEALASELLHTRSKLERQGSADAESTFFIEINPIPILSSPEPAYSDTMLIEPADDEPDLEPYRQLNAQFLIQGQAVQILVRKSKVEYEDLFESILITEFIFIIFLLTSIFLVNRKVLQRVWKPFYQTLDKVMNYQISDRGSFSTNPTDIDEFRKLNQVIEEMITRIEQEFSSLKKFTENASHEIQTPLSVIQNRIELMLQDESLNKEQYANLQDTHKAAGRLSRLNRALLLLTKIENNQYQSTEPISLSEILDSLIEDYRGLTDINEIEIKTQITHGIIFPIHPDLAEVMFRNLLSNAIRHHDKTGPIRLILDENQFVISNPGPEPEGAPSEFFDRFQKGNKDQETLGLGLSIVYAIAKAANLNISYEYENGSHSIVISFKRAAD